MDEPCFLGNSSGIRAAVPLGTQVLQDSAITKGIIQIGVQVQH